MKLREIRAKAVLTKTGIEGFDYCVNPYVGCAHGCKYCYASFMKRFTGHPEPWGEFVDVKVNAPQVLKRQLRRAAPGSILAGTVTDPYQAVESTYGITRECLEALVDERFSVNILTRSGVCLRDIDLFRKIESIEVGLSITTDREEMRQLFEPASPPIQNRIDALKKLHKERVRTYAFIGPMLPLDPVRLAELLGDCVDEVLIDRLNYPNKVKGIYRREGLAQFLEAEWFSDTAHELKKQFEQNGVPVTVIF